MLLNFPTKGVRLDVLRAQLKQRVEVLDEYYKCLDDLHDQLNTLEAELARLEGETGRLEEAYDEVLDRVCANGRRRSRDRACCTIVDNLS